MMAIWADKIFEDIIDTMREAVLVLDSDLSILFANRSFYDLFKITSEETVGNFIYELGNRQWNLPKLRTLLEEILRKNNAFNNYEVEHEFMDIGHKVMLLNARRLIEKESNSHKILLAIEDITERKQLESILKDSEERFRRLFETANDGILLLEKDELKIRYANPAITRLLHYSNEEFVGSDLKDVGFPEDIGSLQEITKTLNKDGIYNYSDALLKNKDGQDVDADVYMVDKTSLVQCNIRDITERKRNADALYETEERFGLAFKCADLGMWDWNIVTGEAIYSERWATMLGYELDELAPNFSTFETLMHPDDKDRIMGLLNQHFENDDFEYDADFRLKTKSGGWMWINARGRVCTRDKEEKPIRMVGTHLDITDRLRDQENLRKSEDFNKRIIESSPDCIKTLDLDGRLQFMSEGGQKLLEIEDIGSYLNQSWIDLWKGPHRKAVLEAISNAKEGNVGKFQGYCPTEKGTPKWWDVIITPVFDKDEKIEQFIAISRDITEKMKEEEERRNLETHLQQAQKMEAIGTLAGGIAHDFNNILSAIIGYSELALMEVPEGSKVSNDVHEVLTAGKRAKDLVKQILTFARKVDDETKPIQVKYILKEALKMLKASVPSSIEIRETIESDATILANPTQVYQVIMNLCTNAVQAMKDDVGVMKVLLKEVSLDNTFSARHPNILPGNYLQLCVEDTGCGMSPDILQKIFDLYFTTKSRGEGTGLGLSVSKGIVDGCKGAITIKSEIGKGSIFDVYFPILEPASRESAPKSEKKETPTGDETVLVIDDDLTIARLNKQLLTVLGYRATTQTSPIEALELFKSDPRRFDLVITDMTMPHMTGDLLAMEIKKIRPDIPVILCTGYSRRMSEEVARATGIDAFLMKPVVKLEMAGTVRKVLDEAKSPTQEET